MKICLITDTHFGCKNDSNTFLEKSLNFFEEVFFPYLIENDIKTVLHLGDLMDRRKFVNFHTLHQVRTRFVDRLNVLDIEFYCILGNHDTYYRNTNSINSVQELLEGRYENIHICDKPTQLDFDGYKIEMIPWINRENQQEILDYLDKSNASMVCGHFELNGYQVMKGVNFEGDMTDEPLRKFESVLSGHFHTKQAKNNVKYLGTPYQLTFSDVNDEKGFHVFDTETRELEFVKNPVTNFEIIYYDDTEKDYENMIQFGCSTYKGKIVKLFVKNKTQPYTFNRLVDRLFQSEVLLLSIVEEIDQSNIKEEEMVDLAQDTLTLINNEVDTLTSIENKSRLKQIISEIYMESLTI